MTKSYKLMALRAWLLDEPQLEGQEVARNASVAGALVLRDPRLVADVVNRELGDVATASETQWSSYWLRRPLEHLVGKGAFTGTAGRLRLTTAVPPEVAPVLAALLHELIEWRLAAYLSRHRSGRLRLHVSHSSGRPIVRFEQRHAHLPEGRTPLRVGDSRLEADFVKSALNVVRERGGDRNVLPDVLWDWFGPDAGKSGRPSRWSSTSTTGSGTSGPCSARRRWRPAECAVGQCHLRLHIG